MADTFEYDVALSFAGEDRPYVDRVAAALGALGVRVFYDKYEVVDLWGKDLYDHLDDVYRKKSRVVVMFVSEHYARKAWPNHERRSAQARAITEKGEYLLPVRFDYSEVPGLRPTVSYVSAQDNSPDDLTDLIARKLVQLGGAFPPAPVAGSVGETNARPVGIETRVRVLSLDGADHVSGVHLLFVAANGTHVTSYSDPAGEARVILPERRLVTVFCAHLDWPAHIQRSLDPADDLTVYLPRRTRTGSVIFENGTGTIPTLSGQLNPILDTSRRTYRGLCDFGLPERNGVVG